LPRPIARLAGAGPDRRGSRRRPWSGGGGRTDRDPGRRGVRGAVGAARPGPRSPGGRGAPGIPGRSSRPAPAARPAARLVPLRRAALRRRPAARAARPAAGVRARFAGGRREREGARAAHRHPHARQPGGGGGRADLADGLPLRRALRPRLPAVRPGRVHRRRAARARRGGRRAAGRRRSHPPPDPCAAPAPRRGPQRRRRAGGGAGGGRAGGGGDRAARGVARRRLPAGRRSAPPAGGELAAHGRGGARRPRGGRPRAGAGRCSEKGRLRITGGKVYDPRNGVDGAVAGVIIDDGRIGASLPDDAPLLDARGLIVMPGGVDIHCHIAGPKVNLARRLEPERHRADPVPRRVVRSDDGPRVLRSGAGGVVPSTFATGYRYAGLGYTSAFEAAVPAIGARQAHQELNDTPVIDKAFFLLFGNDDFLLRLLARGEQELARHYMAYMLRAARAYAVKVVNPGGVAAWKAGAAISGLDEALPGYDGVTPRRIVQAIASAADELGLPHPMHIHCNKLGVP